MKAFCPFILCLFCLSCEESKNEDVLLENYCESNLVRKSLENRTEDTVFYRFKKSKNFKEDDSLKIYMGTGLSKKTYHFKYFLNKKVGEIKCKTNRSIDYCVDSESLDIQGISMGYNNFNQGDSLKICYEHGCFDVLLKKGYSFLKINRKNKGWEAFYVQLDRLEKGEFHTVE